MAAYAAIDPESGVAQTPGILLALVGGLVTLMLIAASLTLWRTRHPSLPYWLLCAGVAGLTGIAAWFLMQDILLVAMLVTVIATLAQGFVGRRTAA